MPRVVYDIPENTKEVVLAAMRKEKNVVVDRCQASCPN